MLARGWKCEDARDCPPVEVVRMDELARAEKELDKLTQAAEADIDDALSTKEQELLED